MTDGDSATALAILIKAILAGLGIGATVVGAGAALPIGIGAATLAAGLAAVAAALQSLARAEKDDERVLAHAQLMAFLQQGFATQLQYQHDLAVFTQNDIHAAVGLIEQELRRALEEVSCTHGEVRQLAEHVTALAGELRALLLLNETQRRLDASLPHGFQRLDDVLWANGGADRQRERRLTPSLFRLDGAYWCDLASDVVALRPQTMEVYHHLQGTQRQSRIALIEGETATGKTTVARHAGFLLFGAGRPVYASRLDELFGLWDPKLANVRGFFQLVSEVLAQVQQQMLGGLVAEEQPLGRPVFLIEDIHSVGHDNAVGFIQELSARLPESADFILCSRPCPEQDPAACEMLTIAEHASQRAAHLRTWTLEAGDAAPVRSLSQHLWSKRWQLSGKPVPFDLTDGTLIQLTHESGGNLWLLCWMLAGHDEDAKTPFRRSDGLKEAHKYLLGTARRSGLQGLETRYSGKPLVPAIMLSVSCFSRWDHPADRFLVRDLIASEEPGASDDILEAISRLGDVGELTWDGRWLWVPHREVAASYLEAAEGREVDRYLGQCLSSFCSHRPTLWQGPIEAMRAASREVSRQIRHDKTGEVEAALLTATLLAGHCEHATGLCGGWLMATALRECFEAAEGELRVPILTGFLYAAMSVAGEQQHNAHRCLEKLVHKDALQTDEVLSVADAIRALPEFSKDRELTRAVGSFVRNDERALEWLRCRWEDGKREGDLRVEVEAAAALAWRGSASREQWCSIYRGLCSDGPPERALSIAWAFPRKAWVRPLRRIIRRLRESDELVGVAHYAWAAQGQCYDADRVVRELAAERSEPRLRQMLLSGSLLRGIASPLVVPSLLAQVRVRKDAGLEDMRLWWALLRLGELWLPEALAGFASAASTMPAEAESALQAIVTTNTEYDGYSATMGSSMKEAALVVSADLRMSSLPQWLEEMLRDDCAFVADDAAEMLGWWEAESALPGLIEALSGHESGIVWQAAGQAIGHIGGRTAVQALLRWPIRLDHPDGSHPLDWEMLNALGNAATDADCALLLIAELAEPDRDPDLDYAVAVGINEWAGQEWDRRRTAAIETDAQSYSRAGAAIRDLLTDDIPRDERATALLLNALSAFPVSDPAISALTRYSESEVPEARTAAVAALAWFRPEDGERWLEMAREIGPAVLSWGDHPLSRIAAPMVVRGALPIHNLSPNEGQQLASHWLTRGDMRHFRALMAQDADLGRTAIRQLAQSTNLQFQGRDVLAYAVTHLAPDMLRELLAESAYERWWESNVLEYALMIGNAFDPSWPGPIIEVAIGFLAWALGHEKTRVRSAAGQAMMTVAPHALPEMTRHLAASDDWRQRAAALEAAALLPDEFFEQAMSQGLRDVDSRVRNNVQWAKERRQQRRVQGIALQHVEETSTVPEAFKWWQCLRACGDDQGLSRLKELRAVRTIQPAKRHWLGKVREAVEKAWADRVRQHDDRLRWTD